MRPFSRAFLKDAESCRWGAATGRHAPQQAAWVLWNKWLIHLYPHTDVDVVGVVYRGVLTCTYAVHLYHGKVIILKVAIRPRPAWKRLQQPSVSETISA